MSTTRDQEPMVTSQAQDGLPASGDSSGAPRPPSNDGTEHHHVSDDQSAQGTKKSDMLQPSSGQHGNDPGDEANRDATPVSTGSDASIQPPSPTQDLQDPYTPKPDPAEVKTQIPGDPTNHDASLADALSVSMEAQSSFNAAQSLQSTTDPDPPLYTPVSYDGHGAETELPSHNIGSISVSPTVGTISVGSTGLALLFKGDGSIIISQDGSPVAASAGGGEIAIGTHVYSIPSADDAVIVDGSTTNAMPFPTRGIILNEVGELTATRVAVWTAGGSALQWWLVSWSASIQVAWHFCAEEHRPRSRQPMLVTQMLSQRPYKADRSSSLLLLVIRSSSEEQTVISRLSLGNTLFSVTKH
jgi:hypothetical protein